VTTPSGPPRTHTSPRKGAMPAGRWGRSPAIPPICLHPPDMRSAQSAGFRRMPQLLTPRMTYTQGGATRSLRLEREHGTDRRHMLTYADEVSQALDTLVMIASRMATPATPSPRAASRQDCVASCFKELQSLFHERLVVLEDAPMTGILIEDELGVRKAARQVDRVAAGHHPVVITIRH